MAEVTAKLAEVMEPEPHVALLNNLGGASALEMSILANDLIKSPIGKNLEAHCWASGADDIPRHARFLRVGLSTQCQRIRDWLSAPCAPSAWPGL
jgi:dihydroxyacetone kinase